MSPSSAPHVSIQRPLLLVSNDDGINSFFLRALVDSLVERYDIIVAAPASEQSWVGRAMTRSGTLEVRSISGWPCSTWSISGRPADCVNLALHHLCPRRPDAVISGMNLGFNTTLALTLSSGTVGAATEGALAGLPAIAFSLAIEHSDFIEVSRARGHRDEEGDVITRRAAERARELIAQILDAPPRPLSVHNINFPASLAPNAPVRRTRHALNFMPSLFAPISSRTDEDGEVTQYQFSFSSAWRFADNPEDSDLKALEAGAISHTLLDWSRLSHEG